MVTLLAALGGGMIVAGDAGGFFFIIVAFIIELICFLARNPKLNSPDNAYN